MAHRTAPDPETDPARTVAVAAAALDTWRGSQAVDEGLVQPVLVPALTIAYHPLIERIGAYAVLHEIAAGEPVLLSRVSPAFSSRSQPDAEPLADRNLSRGPLLLTANGSGVRLDRGDCRTHVAVGGEPLRGAIELSAHDLQRGVVLELAGRVVLLLHLTRAAIATGTTFVTLGDDPVRADLLGESAAMQRLRQDIRRVSDLDVPVLIRGETGTGKELVARAIHGASLRRAGPFVAVNLAAIPGTLAVSELFGADRGAFTGAVRRHAGFFAQAHGGTLFLDEVGEAPQEIQVALLRALETGEIQPVGAQRPQKIDARLLAATDADLDTKITEGSFRAPLLHRLAAYDIWVPALRERRDDIGPLLLHFCEQELAHLGEAHRLRSAPEQGELWLPASLVARLVNYDWPGNVRQLRNVARQLVIGNRGRSRVEFVPSVARLLHGMHASPAVGAASGTSPPAGAAASGTGPPAGVAASGTSPPAGIAAPVSSPPEGDPAAPAQPRLAAGSSAPPAPAPRDASSPLDAAHPEGRRKPAELSEDEVSEALRASRWDLAAAASLLRISRASLYAVIQGNARFRTAGSLSAEDISRAHATCSGDVDRMVEWLEVSERGLRRRLRELGLEEHPARGPGDDTRKSK
ncbi:sigma 54-interacting transcriptional regulator [Sorangium sp. So ce381]|uniref:sigma 54-interacting transcriptional regulator n=1 Tax=Sorangium sp. So ce381 TaxID=3133307 RepID=UPI003F5C0677